MYFFQGMTVQVSQRHRIQFLWGSCLTFEGTTHVGCLFIVNKELEMKDTNTKL